MSAGGDLRDGEAVTAAVRNTSFTGVGGVVALDSSGDRMQSYEVTNYVVEKGDVFSLVAVGVFNGTKQQYKAYGRAVLWPPGQITEVPVDYLKGEL